MILLRTEGILVPHMIHVERLVWIVLKIAERRLLRTLTQSLTLEQRIRLDGLLYADTSIRGATRLSWLLAERPAKNPLEALLLLFNAILGTVTCPPQVTIFTFS